MCRHTAPLRCAPTESRQESPTAQDKESDLVFEGVVEEALPGSQFRIKLENGHEIIAYLSGRMRRNRIRVLLGDRVQIAVSPYDLTRGRITYRYTS